jgi:hypothetical protein
VCLALKVMGVADGHFPSVRWQDMKNLVNACESIYVIWTSKFPVYSQAKVE